MDPQTPDKTSDHLVPFRWPSAWTDPALLGSFSQNPINCLIFENVAAAKPVADAARSAGLTVLEWNSLGAAPLAEVKWDSPECPNRNHQSRVAAHKTVQEERHRRGGRPHRRS